MTPDPIEAAAVECLSLADALPADCRRVVFVAQRLVAVPLTHPMRSPTDVVFAMAERIRHGQVGAEELRAFAGELRTGRA